MFIELALLDVSLHCCMQQVTFFDICDQERLHMRFLSRRVRKHPPDLIPELCANQGPNKEGNVGDISKGSEPRRSVRELCACQGLIIAGQESPALNDEVVSEKLPKAGTWNRISKSFDSRGPHVRSSVFFKQCTSDDSSFVMENCPDSNPRATWRKKGRGKTNTR